MIPLPAKVTVIVLFYWGFLFVVLLKQVRGKINWTLEQWKELNFRPSLSFCCSVTLCYPKYLPDKKVTGKIQRVYNTDHSFLYFNSCHILSIFQSAKYTQSAVLYRNWFAKKGLFCSYIWSLKDNFCPLMLGLTPLINKEEPCR